MEAIKLLEQELLKVEQSWKRESHNRDSYNCAWLEGKIFGLRKAIQLLQGK